MKTASSAISELSYNKKTHVLTVVMAYNPPKSRGETLKFKDVPEEVYKAFLKAASKGYYFNTIIRINYEEV